MKIRHINGKEVTLSEAIKVALITKLVCFLYGEDGVSYNLNDKIKEILGYGYVVED